MGLLLYSWGGDAVSLSTIPCELPQSLVSAVPKAFHFFAWTFLLNYSVWTVIPLNNAHNSLGGIALHSSSFAHWTAILKYIPLSKSVWLALSWEWIRSTGWSLKGNALRNAMRYSTLWIIHLWILRLQTCIVISAANNFLHRDLIQIFSGGSYVVCSHGGSPNAEGLTEKGLKYLLWVLDLLSLFLILHFNLEKFCKWEWFKNNLKIISKCIHIHSNTVNLFIVFYSA